MAIKGALYEALIRKAGSAATLSRWAKALDHAHGPMTPDVARLVIAHDLGIDLLQHSVGAADLERVRTLRASGASLESILPSRNGGNLRPAKGKTQPVRVAEAPAASARPISPAGKFTARFFHSVVVEKSRRLFITNHRSEAIHAAFRSVNNRVKALAHLTGLDGYKLMVQAFSEQSPALRLNDMSSTTEHDEQNGLRHLMAGAMLALRNPRVHEDTWEPDSDVDAALDCLAFASLLHRFLDRCESYAAAATV